MNHTLLSRIFPGMILFLMLPALPAAAEELLSRDTLIAVGAGLTTKEFPNADAVVVDDYTRTKYQADGTYESWNDTCVKALTEKGKRENRTISVSYDVSYGTAEVVKVEILKPDGTVVPVNVAEQSRTMVDRSQMSANIYDPNSKILSVSIADLEIGDMCRYIIRQINTKARMPDTFSDYSVLEYTAPIKHAVVEVYGPQSLPLAHTELKAEVEGTVQYRQDEENGLNHYYWEVHDVPRMYAEPNMPALHTVVQRLLVSTIPDWETVSRWYYELCEPKLESVTPGMKEKVAELTAGCGTTDEKIAAVFHYVSQKIRYMGITTEDTAPGYEPHDVSITFDNKYGVCRDKAALLAAMLRLAGMKAYPVLIYAGPKKDKEVPQPYFNHAITCVEKEDGTYILMDSTDENTKELLPAYLCDKSYIVAKPGGDDLRTSPIVPAEENMMTITTTGSIDAKGTLRAESLLAFSGINDNAYRGAFATMKEEERKRFFEGLVKRVVSGAELKELNVQPEDMMDMSTSLTVRLNYTAEDIMIENDDLLMLPLPWVGTSVSVVNFVLGATGLETRKYPYRTDIACGVRETMKLDIADAVDTTISLPHYSPLDTDTLRWRQSVQYTNRLLSGSSEFLIKAVEFSTNEYLVLKDTLKTIEYDRRKQPIFQTPLQLNASEEEQGSPVYPDADIVVQNESTDYQVLDVHTVKSTVKVRKKVLTYSGKKSNSEIKLDYNPAWDTVQLRNVKVTTKDGEVKELAKEELNLMDAGWVATAPRYPAGKTLVASLPGVDVGSIIEYEIIYVHSNRPFFCATQFFRSSEPIERKTVQLTAPDEIGVQICDSPGGAVDVEQASADGMTTYTWTMVSTNAVKSEKALPPWWSFNPGVHLSAGNWEEYADQVRQALHTAARDQAQARNKGQELVQGLKKPEEKIRAIRDFAAKNVRYAGPLFTSLPLSAISPADRTLTDGYGNGSDIAVVLYAMLDAVGLEPEFVLGSGQPMIEGLMNPMIECPQRTVFGSVLVRVKEGEGYIYLNDTDQYAELGTTSHAQRPALMVKTGTVEPIVVAADKEERTEIEYDVRFTEAGDARITVTRKMYGTGYAGFRRMYSEMPPEERRRHFLELVASLSQAAKATSGLVTDYGSYPGTLSFSAEIDRYAVRDGEYLYFTLPAGMKNVLGLGSDTRENPLYWDNETRTLVTTRISMPESMTDLQLTPPSLTWRAPEGAGTITYTTRRDPGKPSEVTVIQEINLDAAIIPASWYPSLLKTNRKLSHPDVSTILTREEQ